MAIIGNGITTGAAGLDEMITVSDTQPTLPSNKVWVKETSSEIVVPTFEDLDVLGLSVVSGKLNITYTEE